MLSDCNASNLFSYSFVARGGDYGDFLVVLERIGNNEVPSNLFYTCSWFCADAVFASIEELHQHIFQDCPGGYFLKAWRCVRWLGYRPLEYVKSNVIRWSRSGCSGVWEAARDFYSCLCLRDPTGFVQNSESIPANHQCFRPAIEDILFFPFERSAGFYRPVEIPPAFDSYWEIIRVTQLRDRYRNVCKIGSVLLTEEDYWRSLKCFREQVADSAYPCAMCGIEVRKKHVYYKEVERDYVSILRWIAPGSLHLNGKLKSNGRPREDRRRNGVVRFRVGCLTIALHFNSVFILNPFSLPLHFILIQCT